MGSIGPYYRKALALALLCFLVFGLLFGVILPFGNIFWTKQETVSGLENRVARYMNILSREDVYRERLQELRASPLPKIAFEAPSLAVLNSQMQNDVRSLISSSGGRIENLQTLPAMEEGRFRKLGVRVSLRSDMKALTGLLRLLDQHSKLLILDNISMRTSENQNVRRAPEIVIRWDVYGYGILVGDQEAAT